MLRHIIRLENPALAQIRVHASAYEAGDIVIFCSGKNNKLLQTLLSSLKSIIPEATLILINNALICLDIANMTKIYELLREHKLLSDTDRSNIALMMTEIKKVLAQRNTLDHSISKAQDTILRAVDEVYIEDILENCKEYENAVHLLRSAFVGRCTENEAVIKTYLDDYNIKVEVYDSVVALSRMIYGTANLEVTLFNMGHLPRLDNQRFGIMDHCIEKLGETYSKLDDENKFQMYLGLYMVSSPVPCDPFDNFKILIGEALRGHAIALNYFKRPGIDVSITQVFVFMGILSNDHKPELRRVSALAGMFKSELLSEMLHELAKSIDLQPNPLFDALKSNVPSRICQVIDAGPRLSQIISSEGSTPLMYAVTHCSIVALGAILSYQQDLDAFGEAEHNALFAAIKIQSVRKVRMLLAAGASVSFICGVIPTKTHKLFQARPTLSPALPLEVALHYYELSKSNEMGSIILLLLRYGAGINFKFTPKSSTFLDEETIAFGAVLPSNLQSSPITTIEEFTARIPHVDYLYYEGIIKRVLESPTQHSRPLLIEILTQIKALICQLSEKNELASLQATRLL